MPGNSRRSRHHNFQSLSLDDPLACELIRSREDAEAAALASAFEMARSGRYADLQNIKAELVKNGHYAVTPFGRGAEAKTVAAVIHALKAGQ